MVRVFLDANVLYSAAYLERSRLARIVNLTDVHLVTSVFAAEEARRNLANDRPEALPRLTTLLSATETIDAPSDLKVPEHIRLNPKDRPILAAAIYAKADYLVTGDARHFAHLYGERIEGVLVLRPSEYFRHHKSD